MGRLDDALHVIQQAVKIQQKLVMETPNPDLAKCLNNLGNCLAHLGRRGEALDAIQQAVDIRRMLAIERPETFNADLASSLPEL